MFKNNDRMLICVNTHFDFNVSVQIESARLIIKQLSHLPPDLSAVLIGDFNAAPDSPCHMIFTGEDQEAGTGQSRPFQNAFSESFPGTIHKFTGNTKGEHIDWILYRGGIMKKNCEVIQDAINGIYPSDHFPLFASFIWEA
jgi:endonuclease/exonuclease/phosphatase family metal-dependent hydrolase